MLQEIGRDACSSVRYQIFLSSQKLVDIVVGGCLERIRLSEFTCLEDFLDSNYMIVR
jgi:hypothetical protein